MQDLVQTLDTAVTQSGERLVELSEMSPVLLVFLRHAGCTFCREALADFAYVEGAAGVNEIFFLQAHDGTTIKGLGLYNYNANGVTIWNDSDWNFIDDDYIGFKKTNIGVSHNNVRAPSCAGVGIQGNYNKVRRTTISGVYNGINVGEAIEKPAESEPPVGGPR